MFDAAVTPGRNERERHAGSFRSAYAGFTLPAARQSAGGVYFSLKSPVRQARRARALPAFERRGGYQPPGFCLAAISALCLAHGDAQLQATARAQEARKLRAAAASGNRALRRAMLSRRCHGCAGDRKALIPDHRLMIAAFITMQR